MASGEKKKSQKTWYIQHDKKKHTADSKFYTQNKKEKKLMQVK